RRCNRRGAALPGRPALAWGVAPGRVQRPSKKLTRLSLAFGMNAARLGAPPRGGSRSKELTLVTAIGTATPLLLGRLSGMLTHKRAERWCPVDGSRLQCLQCARAGLHVLDGTGTTS